MTELQRELNQIWPGWIVEEKLGEGSFGKVYRIVREDGMGHRFSAALKRITIPASESEFHAAINEGMSEETATAYFSSVAADVSEEIVLLSHFKGNSNIVSYEDHEIRKAEDGIRWDIFIRMELLTPLYDYMKTNPMSVQDVIHLGIDICRALELCQNNNIIHRDIKPENIFVSDFGDFKLGDFGIARQLEKTSTFMSKKGTYSYMAPEVYRGEPYDASVDTYSLGMVLYRLLNNGRGPFMPPASESFTPTDRENANVRRLGGEGLPPPENAPGELGMIILKACAIFPEDRFEDARAFREALENVRLERDIPYSKEDGTVRLAFDRTPTRKEGYSREPSGSWVNDSPYPSDSRNAGVPPDPGGSRDYSYTDREKGPRAKRNRSALSGQNKKLILISMLTVLIGMTVVMGFFIIVNVVRSGKSGRTAQKVSGDKASSEKKDQKKAGSKSAALDKPRNMKVAIDPGCVGCEFPKASVDPVGPGAKTFSKKYSNGGIGPTTGIREYDVNLGVARYLDEELKARGYTTLMLREDNETRSSGKERAERANKEGADIFVRIFCRQQQDDSKRGAMVYEPTVNNPYVSHLFEESNELGLTILENYCNATEFENAGPKYIDDSNGINWSQIPVAQIMIGCINDPADEQMLADENNWKAMAKGIADGIDEYYSNNR